MARRLKAMTSRPKLELGDRADGVGNAPENGVNKDLPLNPKEQAGLREHVRSYSRELHSKKKVLIDPNHAWPNAREATTLRLTGTHPRLDIKCGPLLKYVYTDYNAPRGPLALYTLLLVTNDVSGYPHPPVLEIAGIDTEEINPTLLNPEILHRERGVTFWRWKIYLTLIAEERRLAYNINGSREDIGFWVPGAKQPMRAMFYSCNGFSQSVNPDDFQGPDPLWRDVLRKHQQAPWHVMLGGGDQLYSDGISKRSKLFRAWLQIDNLHHKFSTPYTKELKNELEEFYLENYCEWFHQGQYSHANAQIPMQNIFDDHDIIDGFGSYPNHFMKCPVFSNLGRVAFKYYLLFQQQSSIAEERTLGKWDKGTIFGIEKGPYITERSRSIVNWLGKDVLFLGIWLLNEPTGHRD